MAVIKNTIISGFNELVQTIQGIEKQFPEQEHLITFLSFNGLGEKLLHFADPASKLEHINANSYNPKASTPLFDAMGLGINKLKEALQGIADYNVLVTILTDGEENASREFSGSNIKSMVEELKQNRWTFTYIGTDHDVDKIADSLSIDNRLAFKKKSRWHRGYVQDGEEFQGKLQPKNTPQRRHNLKLFHRQGRGQAG